MREKGEHRDTNEREHPETHTEFIEEPHGKHGGSPESEGSPQEGSGGSSTDGSPRNGGRTDERPADRDAGGSGRPRDPDR